MDRWWAEASAGFGRGTIAWALAASLAVALALADVAIAEPALPGGFQDTIAFAGLKEPTAVRFAPDGRVFVAEKAGEIKVYEGLEDATPEVFADLRTEVYDHGDRGLLGLEVDPAFPARPYVYALFTYDHVLGESEPPPRWGTPEHSGDSCPDPKGADDCPVSGRLVRLTADAEGTQAIAETPLIAEDWCQQFSSHSIGDLRFGPEGALFASAGEGANFVSPDYGQFGEPANPCGDPAEEGGSLRSQDLLTPADPTGLDGSIIRIDPDTGEGWPGNPYAASSDENARRIVAFGLRNPFRFAIDPVTGEFYAGNVGLSEFEELDRFTPSSESAFNSGWPCFEGAEHHFLFKELGLPLCEGLYAEPEPAPPFFYYSHAHGITDGDSCSFISGSAISGLAFYGGTQFPSSYQGALFFSDSVRNCFYVMRAGEDGRPDPLSVEPFMTEGSLYPGIDIQEGPDGALYYTSLFGVDYSEDGAVHRIGYSPGAPVARLSADREWGETPLEVTLDASKSSDPGAEELEFEWDLDGDGTFESAGLASRALTLTEAENVVVAVRVEDGEGLSSVDRLTLYPGDAPPVPEIISPLNSLTWGVGDEVHLEGSAVDSEGAPLYGQSLRWSTRLYHCPTGPEYCHAHPLQVFPGTKKGDLLTPEHDLPSYIEVTFSASDHRGLAASETVRIDPRTVDLDLSSNPPGVRLTAGLVSELAPFATEAIEGSNVLLAAPASAELNGRLYTWEGWSDGGDRIHTVSAAADAAYTAVFAAAEGPDEEAGEPVAPEVVRPQTWLRKRPARQTRRTTARFAFLADGADDWFQCKLDAQAYKTCHSPRVYRHLRRGRHTIRIRALTLEGKADLTPVSFSWRVLKPKRRQKRHSSHGRLAP